MSKVPPPPNLANQDPAFNRWLLTLTSILNADGTINTGSVQGLDVIQNEVDANSAAIAQNTQDIQTISTALGGLGGLQVQIDALNTSVLALTARSQVLNGAGVPGAGLGNDGDWYAKTTAAFHIYVKVTGAWVQLV